MLSNSSFLDSSRRESRKRRRLSERRRVFSRLSGQTGDFGEAGGEGAASQSCSRRRSSLFKREQVPEPKDEPSGFLVASGDQGKISMKIQFHIIVAPENEPLLLEPHQLAGAPAPPAKSPVQRQQSAESSSAIGEHINERLNRQNSSTRRRQQLLAMHQQSALEKEQRQQRQQQQQQQQPSQAQNIRSEDNLTFVRSDSLNDGHSVAGSTPLLAGGRESGARSSTITGGMQDEATMQFLARHQQHQQQQQLRHAHTSASLGSSGSLLGQQQTLMASANNMRQRHEQREHIYFKRDGQRFGHEFTLKLAVDKSYRCLLKVRPLIPLEALSIQGHHVSFVDCSARTSVSSTSGSAGLAGLLSSSAPASSMALSGAENSISARHQSSGNILNGPRHNSIASPTSSQRQLLSDHHSQLKSRHELQRAQRGRLNHAQTTIGSGATRRTSILNCDLVAGAGGKQDGPDPSGSSLSLSPSPSGTSARLQQQLLKQHQQNQMIRHFSSSSSVSSSHPAGQLVYMFDWSAGRFEVNKNKARTQLQTVLKFKNGQILSLPLQIKFYQPECKQHLSWGSQLHFIDYDCNIDSMGQMSVDRIQYY